jgi:hypothetical protein
VRAGNVVCRLGLGESVCECCGEVAAVHLRDVLSVLAGVVVRLRTRLAAEGRGHPRLTA